ncbi:hypothetical protein LSPH24S_06733 [Lysinibacillus sphaericus]
MKQIIALGGGGFSMEPENPLLDQYILQQSMKKNPKICFLATASGDSENYICRFYQFFEKQDCQPSHLSLFKPPTRNIESFLLDKDIIYVGGNKEFIHAMGGMGIGYYFEKSVGARNNTRWY